MVVDFVLDSGGGFVSGGGVFERLVNVCFGWFSY